jgi:AcrR family transcriptional regulator
VEKILVRAVGFPSARRGSEAAAVCASGVAAIGATISVSEPTDDVPVLLPDRFQHLAPRNAPTQRRAKETVARILDTAAALIDEVGLEAFNTNLLAERAGVRIRTVYRYFPNKVSVIAALMMRFHAESEEEQGPVYWLGDRHRDWRAIVSHWIDVLLDWARRTPGALLLTGDLQGIPELLDLKEHLDEVMTANLIRALRARGLSLPDRQLYAVCRTYIDATDALVALAAQKRSDYCDELVDEVKLLITSYLANYLD